MKSSHTNNPENINWDALIEKALQEDMKVSDAFSDKLDSSINSWELEEQKNTKRIDFRTLRRNIIVWATSAAAIVTILFSVNHLENSNPPSTTQSYAEAQIILSESVNTLSYYLQKGQKNINTADQKLNAVENKLNKIIKNKQ
ncbi:hypothetical protein N9251_02145 [Gammaproteobacteria bacterium]|nr:hypothetical protein [Gammaproteobacteria bacterium]